MGTRASLPVAPARSEERWRPEGGRARRSAIVIVGASLFLHGALVTTALLSAHVASVVGPLEIPVEVVQEPSIAKPEPVRAPAKGHPPAPPVKAPSRTDAQRSSLEQELAALKAEKAALSTKNNGAGPLRDSIRAVALPSTAGDGADGDLVGYQQLVFSQLAKAKEGIDRVHGSGSAGVRFALDEGGRLAELAVAVSSGDPALDEEAMTIVRRASPFPPPPPGTDRVFSANVSFTAALP